MKQALLFTFLLLFPGIVSAEDVTVTVKGMVCSFCAQGLKKTFSKEDAVENIAVDLDTKKVKIKVRTGKTLSDEQITALIIDAGYDILSIERSGD